MKPDVIVGGLAVLLAGLVANTTPVRSRLTTPATRAVGAGLLAAAFAVTGILVERLVFNAP